MTLRRYRGAKLLLLLAAFALVVAACSSGADTTTTTTAAAGSGDTATTTTAAPSDAGSTTTAAPADSGGTPVDVPGFSTWEEVLAAADGSTVNWFMWGGSETINANVDNDIGKVMKERYNITLNRVPITDTVDVVNKVLDESAAGVDTGGTVDLIWINGENFRTLKSAGLLYGPWSESIPNASTFRGAIRR